MIKEKNPFKLSKAKKIIEYNNKLLTRFKFFKVVTYKFFPV